MKRKAMSPPPWAEWVLVALLPAERAESESGDLLEAYRDEQLPARGRAAADWWYIRQVALVFAHGYWFWLVGLIALFVISDVSNAYRFAPWGRSGLPARVLPLAAMCLIFGASVRGGWRSLRMSSGLLTGAATSTLLWLFMAAWWMTTWYPFALVQQMEPYWIDAWRSSAAPGETFLHWIFWDNVGATIMSGMVLNAAGLGLGLAGGVAGAAARKRSSLR
jgi:hypothetical protein